MWKRSQIPLVCGLLVLVRLVVDIFQRQVELVLVPLRVAAVFAAAIGQHSAERDDVLLEERQHPVIEQIGRRDRRLDVIELGERHLRIGVDEGLLIDVADPLNVPT